jgi:hypothetical protein
LIALGLLAPAEALDTEENIRMRVRIETPGGPLEVYPALVIERQDYRSYPRLQCQFCRRLIDDANMAIVTWPSRRFPKPDVGPPIPVLVLCKGDPADGRAGCVEKPGIKRWSWQTPSANLIWLMANTGLHGEARQMAERKARRLSAL